MKPPGFTLVETLIVISVASAIGLYSMVVSQSSLVRSELSSERDTFVALVALPTRSAALTNQDATTHGMYFDHAGRRYILFEGLHYQTGVSTNRIIPYATTHTLVTSSGGDEIIFEQHSSNVRTGAGQITFTSGTITQTVDISSVGQINW